MNEVPNTPEKIKIREQKKFIKNCQNFLKDVYSVKNKNEKIIKPNTNDMINNPNYFTNKPLKLDKVNFENLTEILINNNFKEKLKKIIYHH